MDERIVVRICLLLASAVAAGAMTSWITDCMDKCAPMALIVVFRVSMASIFFFAGWELAAFAHERREVRHD